MLPPVVTSAKGDGGDDGGSGDEGGNGGDGGGIAQACCARATEAAAFIKSEPITAALAESKWPEAVAHAAQLIHRRAS